MTDDSKGSKAMTTVVCVKWGEKYGAEYVNKLHAMVRRHASGRPRFVCFTDDADGINKTIECKKLPEKLEGWWNKLIFFTPLGLEPIGEKLLFLDLDVVIVDSIDPLLQHPGDFVIIRDWWQPNIYNSSVFLLMVGTRPQVWDAMVMDASFRDASAGDRLWPDIHERYASDQEWITEQVADAEIWPAQWCVSFKNDCVSGIPDGARIVCFHGRPKPHEYPAPWVKKMWR